MTQAVRPSTALAAAMQRAGVDVDAARLHVVAADAMRRAGGDPAAARRALVDEVRGDAGLLRALIGDEEIARRAAELLTITARDMRGQTLRSGDQLPRAVDGRRPLAPASQPTVDAAAQRGHAPRALEALPPASAPAGEAGGQEGIAAKAVIAALPASPSDAAAAGQTSAANRAIRSVLAAAAPHHVGPGQPRIAHAASEFVPAPVVSRKPNPPRGLAAMAAAQAPLVRSVMDTFRLADGRPVGDVCWGEINGLIVANGREGRVLRAIRMHIAEAPGDALVRDIVRASVIEAALAEVPENV